MALELVTIWKKVLTILRRSIGPIFAIHLAYVALGVVLFAPLVGMFGQAILHLSGRPILADQDIVYFLLTPLGIAALILTAALLITIMAFEQASMMARCAGDMQGVDIGIIQALHFTASRVVDLFFFSLQLAARVLAIILPFLAAGGAVAWLLLRQYDINYYLNQKPTEFIVAAVLLGLLLATLSIVLVRSLLLWPFALPLVLFGNVGPAHSFVESKKIAQGHKRFFLLTFGTWAVMTFLLGTLVLAIVEALGSMLVPLFFTTIRGLVVVLGGLVMLWSLCNLLITTVTAGSFACLLVTVFERSGSHIQAGNLAEVRQGKPWRLTLPGLTLLLIGGVALASFSGAWLLNGIKTEDTVEIVAHRGAAGKTPENTLAAIRQAMDDGTDWVEIDVQETKDGEVVVIHDSDFMKLAGVNLKVAEGTLEQVQEIDVGSWFAPEFSSERVPTLAEVLEEARGKSRVVIELKYYGMEQQLESRVVTIVEQADMVADTAIMSLKFDGISKIRELRPDWKIGLLSAQAFGNLTGLDVDFLAVNLNMATPRFIRTAQSAGRQVYVWTVNDQVTMSRMMSLGVNGIITDEPEMARKVLAERAEMNSVERLLIHTAVVLGRPVPQRQYRDQSP